MCDSVRLLYLLSPLVFGEKKRHTPFVGYCGSFLNKLLSPKKVGDVIVFLLIELTFAKKVFQTVNRTDLCKKGVSDSKYQDRP